tara:strand:- start:283 stop:495 length:213 start_codon:yes stop_codon:yes gene_type:complete
MIRCSKCDSDEICEIQWHHVNESVVIDGQPYYKLEEGDFFNTSYCDNDYQCLNCYRNGSNPGSDVYNDKT